MAARDRERQIVSAVAELDALDAADAALRSGDVGAAAERLAAARALRLRLAPTVPHSVAARLLEVSLPTIRQWAAAGALEDAGTKPRSVTLDSVIRARGMLAELREVGRGRDLREALLARLDDELTLGDQRLQRSLNQMRSRRKHIVHAG